VFAALVLLAAAPQKPVVPAAPPAPVRNVVDGPILAVIDKWVDAVEKSDRDRLLSLVWVDGVVVTVSASGTGGARPSSRNVSWIEFSRRMPAAGNTMTEHVTDRVVRTDGTIATVWGNAQTRLNGHLLSCGNDTFDLLRGNDGWKILNIVRSQRTSGCGE
jgi:hypothetical protein